MSIKLSAVIPAAGSSRRVGFDKLLTPVSGVTFLQYTLQKLLKSPHLTEIALVISPEREAEVKRIVENLVESRPIHIVHGGAQRQDSVFAGIQATNPDSDFVMIHDAARPFVTPSLIDLVFTAAQATGAAVCGSPCTDTLKEAGPDDLIASTLDRGKIWSVQTPQIFRRALILEAYQKTIAGGQVVTDDTAAVQALGHPVKLVLHEGLNLKITHQSDWAVAIRMLMALDEDIKAAAEIRTLIHDISNQITSVMGFSFLLDMDIPDDSPLKDHVKSLNDSSTKCHAIISAMQSLARDIHAKKSEMQVSIDGGTVNPTLGH